MREVLDVHAIPALIHAIDRHKTKAPVAERGLAAFGNLLLSGGGLAAAQAVRHRGLDLVSDCMRSHSKNMHILLQACNCYINAAAVSLEVKEVIATNPQVRTQHSISISQAPQHRHIPHHFIPSPHTHLQVKGVERVLEILYHHPHDSTIVIASCAALANVAAGEQFEHDEEMTLEFYLVDSTGAGDTKGSAWWRWR